MNGKARRRLAGVKNSRVSGAGEEVVAVNSVMPLLSVSYRSDKLPTLGQNEWSADWAACETNENRWKAFKFQPFLAENSKLQSNSWLVKSIPRY